MDVSKKELIGTLNAIKLLIKNAVHIYWIEFVVIHSINFPLYIILKLIRLKLIIYRPNFTLSDLLGFYHHIDKILYKLFIKVLKQSIILWANCFESKYWRGQDDFVFQINLFDLWLPKPFTSRKILPRRQHWFHFFFNNLWFWSKNKSNL